MRTAQPPHTLTPPPPHTHLTVRGEGGMRTAQPPHTLTPPSHTHPPPGLSQTRAPSPAPQRARTHTLGVFVCVRGGGGGAGGGGGGGAAGECLARVGGRLGGGQPPCAPLLLPQMSPPYPPTCGKVVQALKVSVHHNLLFVRVLQAGGGEGGWVGGGEVASTLEPPARPPALQHQHQHPHTHLERLDARQRRVLTRDGGSAARQPARAQGSWPGHALASHVSHPSTATCQAHPLPPHKPTPPTHLGASPLSRLSSTVSATSSALCPVARRCALTRAAPRSRAWGAAGGGRGGGRG